MSKFTEAQTRLHADVLDEFADPIRYEPLDDDLDPVTITGVFDENCETVQLGDDGMGSASVLQIVFDVRLSDLPALPVEGDSIYLNYGTPQQRTFLVNTHRPSDDWTRIVVREVHA